MSQGKASVIWRASQPCVGIWGDIEMDDFSSLMAEDDQGVEKPKPCRYDNEHVDGGGVMHVIVQERAPGRGGDLGPPRQVSADRGLADLDAELEQLAVDAGSAPQRVCLAHLADQVTDLAVRCRAVPGGVIAAASRGGSLYDASRSRLPV